MKEQLKASVLAKCQDLAPMKHGISQFWDESGYVRKTMLSNHEMAWELCQKVWNEDGNSGKIVTSISLFESLPATHINWSIAADLLGIKPKEERPLDALLIEAWKAGKRHSGFGEVVINQGIPAFYEWAATLPTANLVELPEYDKAFEDSLFAWASAWARENNDLGWNEDGRHTYQSIFEHGLINGAKHMYRIIYGKEHPNV